MINFCTLFDSYYLDKGLALYRSLEKQSKDFRLFLFCFDDRSYEVLQSLQLEHAEIIHHTAIEDERLLAVKKERSKAEYCWTCTPVIIEYVLEHFPVDNCTYIDADMYFFADPQLLFDEISKAKANVVITPHRFTNSVKDQRTQRRSGKYCVEFNYFDQSENAREALNWWKERCLEWCYHLYEPERMGDQKYLEKFPVLFQGVHELQYLGGGIAPWNLNQYSLDRVDGDFIHLMEKATGIRFQVVLYHFQNLRYINEHTANISSETRSKELKNAIYRPYLQEIENSRKILAAYDVNFSVKKGYSSNKLIAFLQKNVLRFKVKSLSDIYDLRQFR